MATDALVRSCTSRRVEFIFRMTSVRVVVVVSLCGADMILGSDFLLASGATVCLGSMPRLSFASGTIPIRFDEIEPIAANCEVSVEVPSHDASSSVPRPEPADSVSSVVDPPAVSEGSGLLTRSNPQSFSSSVSSVVDPPAVSEGSGLLTRSDPQSFSSCSSPVSSVVDHPASGGGPGLLTRPTRIYCLFEAFSFESDSGPRSLAISIVTLARGRTSP